MRLREPRATRTLLLAGILGLAALASAWVAEDEGGPTSTYQAVAIDTDGHIVVGGGCIGADDECATVAELDAPTGATRWIVEPYDCGIVTSVALRANDDVITGGSAAGECVGGTALFTVERRDGDTGGIQWTFNEIEGTANAVAVDGMGDVVATGRDQDNGMFVVVKLDGDTGAEVWRYDAPGFGNAIAVDNNGDVLAAGRLFLSGRSEFAVVKVDGDTGDLLWDEVIPSAGRKNGNARSLVVDADGNAFVAGSTSDAGLDLEDDSDDRLRFTVARFAALDGVVTWNFGIPALDAFTSEARSVALGLSGEVFATGLVRDGGLRWVVVRLAGATGVEAWRERFSTSGSGGRSVVVALDGDPVVTGSADVIETQDDVERVLTVMRLDRADGELVWDWTQDRQESGDGFALASDLVADRLAVAGQLEEPREAPATGTDEDFAAVFLDLSTGEDILPPTTTTTATSTSTTEPGPSTTTSTTIPRSERCTAAEASRCTDEASPAPVVKRIGRVCTLDTDALLEVDPKRQAKLQRRADRLWKKALRVARRPAVAIDLFPACARYLGVL